MNKIDLLTAEELTTSTPAQSPYPTPGRNKEDDDDNTGIDGRESVTANAAAVANREYSDFYEAAIWNGQPNPNANPNPNFNQSVNDATVKEGRKERGRIAVTELTSLWKQRLPAAGMCVCMYICIPISLYVCMYVCTYVCIY